MLSESSQAATCTKFLCGPNSPILGGVPFFQLDQTGTTPAPEHGFRIVSFSKGWLPLEVDVEGARLRGRFARHLVLQGEQLVGANLVLEDEHGLRYRISLEERAQLQSYWEDGDDGTLLESWRMTSTPLPNDGGAIPQAICNIEPDTTSDTSDDLGHHALIFRGDRYDSETGDVIATGQDAGPWFNIACAGDALAKLLVIRHAQAAHDAAHPTTREQREAALRMFRADYCGTGQPNTQLGTPIDWANAGGWNFLDKSPTLDNVEAIWAEGGAVCVTNPRHIDRDDISCDIPACTQEQVNNWQEHGDLITINP
ncbi:MAG: hypothetical protein HOV81_15340 [Kofleriaceae bacterium]|nr:hypothetical protein [Kofleriaceae bacterium]